MPTTTQPASGPGIRRAVVGQIADLTLRESGDPAHPREINLAGHAAVFSRLSHDLGGFRERISPGAFTRVLDAQPDVHLVIGHDMNRPIARTTSKTLELREDPAGLHVWARLNPEDPDVRALVPKMERGDVDQMSFAFTVKRDTWIVENDGSEERVIRTIDEVDDLFDVSVVAQGAYPQTDANLRSVLDAAIESGRVPIVGRASENVAASEPGDSDPSQHELGGEFERRRAAAIARLRLSLT